MSESSLLKEYKEFSQKALELQQQYRVLVTQVIPSSEAEARSMNVLRSELESIPLDTNVYRSVGKMFLSSNVDGVKEKVEESLATLKRVQSINSERKSAMEKNLKEMEDQNKIYLTKSKAEMAQ